MLVVNVFFSEFHFVLIGLTSERISLVMQKSVEKPQVWP